jgi:hypothetical protein
VPCEWRRKCGETGTSLIPASRAARLTRFHALTALIGKTQSSPMVSAVRSTCSSAQVPRESRTTRVLPPLPVTFATPSTRFAPSQRHQLRHPQSAVIKEADQSVVARPIVDRLEQREDLALAQNPLRQLLLEGRPVDRGAGVERQVSHPGRERQQRFKGLEPAAAGGRRADEAVRVTMQIREVRGAQRLAGEASEGRDVVAIGADGVRALAVQPQGDEFSVGGVGRNRRRRDRPISGRHGGRSPLLLLRRQRGRRSPRCEVPGCRVGSPLAFDSAVSEEAAKTKGIDSPVAGRADIFVVPDLEAGNMLAKELEYLAEAQVAGIVLGARVPIILTSRADKTLARLGSCAIALLLARHASKISFNAPSR